MRSAFICWDEIGMEQNHVVESIAGHGARAERSYPRCVLALKRYMGL